MRPAERPRSALFVCHYLHHVVGGAEIIAHRIVQFLRAAGWRVETVVLPGPRPAPADATHHWNLPGRMNPASLLAKQLAVYAGGVIIDQTAARAVLPALRGRTFDIVVAHDTVSGGAASILARTLGIPWACFVYEPLPRALPNAPGPKGWIGGMLTRHANRAMRRLLPRATLRIAASADTGRRLDAFAPGPPTVVAYNSAPVLETPPPPGEGLLFVGRLSTEKGFDLLCEAYKGLASPPPLNIAALDGPLAGLARDLSRQHPSVRLLPRTTPEDMPSLYARHGVVVAPSAWPDPLPGAVLEARALQRALLVSDQGGIPEIVQGYRPLRVVPMSAPREHVIQGLRLALSQAPEWARRQPDPKAEALFRQRHAPQAHASAVITGLERAIALARRTAPSTPPKA